jgi:hypothetical protein
VCGQFGSPDHEQLASLAAVLIPAR